MVKKILRILCTISGIYLLLDFAFIIYARLSHNDSVKSLAVDGIKELVDY